jgi:hypothetical protein
MMTDRRDAGDTEPFEVRFFIASQKVIGMSLSADE